MRYNTGNPVGADGSSSPFDLYDNADSIDVWANERTKTQWPDRLGVALGPNVFVSERLDGYAGISRHPRYSCAGRVPRDSDTPICGDSGAKVV